MPGVNETTAMRWNEHIYSDLPALVGGVSARVEAACRHAIAQRGTAFLSLAGGRTPLPIYAHLAQAHLGGPVLALPGDERCVPHDHPACNLGNLRAAFAADPQIQVHALTVADGDVDASLTLARAFLAAHPQPFDVVLLGMGADGHFASLFPGAANLAEGMAQDSGIDAIATVPDPLPPEAPYPRISLSLPRLLHARDIHLVVTGADKRQILNRARQDANAPFPVATLLHAAASQIHIHWSP